MKRFSTLMCTLICLIVSTTVLAQQTAKPSNPARAARSKRGAEQNIQFLNADPNADRPFSDAVRVGGILYLSGRIGTDLSGKLAQGGIAAETRQALENIRQVLERNGSSMDRVVKCTVMLQDINEWAAMNEVYMTFFERGRRPARSALGASGLAMNARVEIECIAVLK